MVDISTFQTRQAAASGASAKSQTGASTGVFSGTPGMNFMDLIFARVTADSQNGQITNPLIKAGKGKPTTPKADMTGHGEPLTQEQLLQALRDAGLSPEEIAALTNEEVSAKGEAEAAAAPLLSDVEIDNKAGIKNTPELEPAVARKKLIAFLENLVAGLPQENKPVVLNLSAGELKQALGKLQFSTEDGATGPTLIATGLTPEKLTEILQDLTDGNDQGEGLVIGMVKILPTEAKKDAIFLPRGVVVVQPQSVAGDVNQQNASGDLAAKLNALTTGEGGEDAFPLEESDFDGVLRVLERAQSMGKKNGQQAGDGKGIENAIKKIESHIGAGLSTISGAPPALSEMFTNFAMDGVFPEGMDFGYSAPNGQSMTLTGTAQLASLVSHAQQAGTPHPATQMVAATITKAATNGESKTISIRLDPPELGRVSIKMEFHKDKGVKAVLTAEKPETFMMMQRDSHVLQRALEEAGLDVNDGALSFELSQDGNLFQHDQQSGHGGSGGSGGAAEDAEETGTEIAIETTMDWYADPDTGVMRYSTLV